MQIAPIVDAYAHAMHVVFLAAVPVAGAAFVLALFLKEVPLRESSRAGAADVGGGFGMPESGDSNQQLQVAIARLIRTRGGPALDRLRRTSGTDLDVANAWCLGESTSATGSAATRPSVRSPVGVGCRRRAEVGLERVGEVGELGVVDRRGRPVRHVLG